MSAESFKILKEINSLSMRKNELIDLEAKENKRITFIENNRLDREELKSELQDKLKNCKAELMSSENEINSLSLKIDKDKMNLVSLIDETSILSLQKQIDEMKEKLNFHEEKGLDLLEQMEHTEQEIEDCIEFLSGSLESLTEIKKEVSQKVEKYHKEIQIILKRDSLLKDELPANFRSRIDLILKKNINISSFTRIKSESCEFCRLKLSKVDIIAIEDNFVIKSCQGCSRIFIPIQSAY